MLEKLNKTKIKTDSGAKLLQSMIVGLTISFPDLNGLTSNTLSTTTSKRVAVQRFSETELISFILDPRHKNRASVPAKIKQKAIQLLREKYRQYRPKILEKRIRNQKESLSLPSLQLQEENEFFEDDQPINEEDKDNDEIDEYLSRRFNPSTILDSLKWWQKQKQYPVLQALAARYLSIPASSASIERIFSLSGLTFKKRRNRMSRS